MLATLSAYCMLLTKVGKVDQALQVLKTQAAGQRRLTSSFTEPLVRLLHEAKRYSDIFDMLKMLLSWKLTPPKLVFEILLPYAAEKGDKEQMHILLQALRDPTRPTHEGPGIWIYNATLISLARRGDLYWFEKVIKYLRKRSITFNSLTFAVHVVALRRAERLEDARALAADLLQRKISYSDIIASYKEAILLYGRTGQTDYFEEILDQLSILGLAPSAEIFQTMLLVYARLNMEVELLKMLEMMSERWQLQPDTSCINQLLLLYSFRGNWSDAAQVFDLLMDPDFPDRKPDVFSYYYLTSAYARAGRVADAIRTFGSCLDPTRPAIWDNLFYKMVYDFATHVLLHNKVYTPEEATEIAKKWNRPANQSTLPMSHLEKEKLLIDYAAWKAKFESSQQTAKELK